MKKTLSIFCFIISIQFGYTQTNELQQTTKDSLKTYLEVLFKKDQTFRRLYKHAEEKFGKQSLEMDYFWEVVEEQDKLLQNKVIKILDTYGWLGISKVGRLANTALWIIIQHGSSETKRKYSPLLKASVLQKESQPMHYARMIDRMLINENKPQVYGSQTTYDKNGTPILYEMIEPVYVDQRRASIGLPPISDFLKQKNIIWDIEQKKK